MRVPFSALHRPRRRGRATRRDDSRYIYYPFASPFSISLVLLRSSLVLVIRIDWGGVLEKILLTRYEARTATYGSNVGVAR